MYTVENLMSALYPITEAAENNDDIEPCEDDEEASFDGFDYSSLLQAIRNNAGTVYEYETNGTGWRCFKYRGKELFHQRATLLFRSMEKSTADIVVVDHNKELWLLEDMRLVVVSVVTLHVEADKIEYTTEYRAIQGMVNRASDLEFDAFDVAKALEEMCYPYYENEAPIYEL